VATGRCGAKRGLASGRRKVSEGAAKAMLPSSCAADRCRR
jgi:hypothetical protein